MANSGFVNDICCYLNPELHGRGVLTPADKADCSFAQMQRLLKREDRQMPS